MHLVRLAASCCQNLNYLCMHLSRCKRLHFGFGRGGSGVERDGRAPPRPGASAGQGRVRAPPRSRREPRLGVTAAAAAAAAAPVPLGPAAAPRTHSECRQCAPRRSAGPRPHPGPAAPGSPGSCPARPRLPRAGAAAGRAGARPHPRQRGWAQPGGRNAAPALGPGRCHLLPQRLPTPRSRWELPGTTRGEFPHRRCAWVKAALLCSGAPNVLRSSWASFSLLFQECFCFQLQRAIPRVPVGWGARSADL